MVSQPRRGGGRLWRLRDLVAKQKTPGSQTHLLQDNKYISHALPGRATHRPPPKTQNAHEHLSTCYDSSNVLLPAHGLRRGEMNYSSLCAMMSVLCQPRPSAPFLFLPGHLYVRSAPRRGKSSAGPVPFYVSRHQSLLPTPGSFPQYKTCEKREPG